MPALQGRKCQNKWPENLGSLTVKMFLSPITDMNMTDSKKIIYFNSLQKADKTPKSLNPALTKPAANYQCHQYAAQQIPEW